MAKNPKKPLIATDLTAQAARQATSAYDQLRQLKADLASATSAYDELRRATAPALEAMQQATAAASTHDELRRLGADLASVADFAAGVAVPRIIAAPAPLQASARALPPPASSRAPSPVGAPADFGRMVRQAREAMNLTQAEFADMAGVGRRFVSELENGKATLELGKVMAACAAAGLSLLVGPR